MILCTFCVTTLCNLERVCAYNNLFCAPNFNLELLKLLVTDPNVINVASHISLTSLMVCEVAQELLPIDVNDQEGLLEGPFYSFNVAGTLPGHCSATGAAAGAPGLRPAP